MNPARSEWPSILFIPAAVLLVTAVGTHLVAAWAYVMGPPRADADPFIFLVVAVVLLGPSIALGFAIKRARLVSLHWDFGRASRSILIVGSSLIAVILALGGVYAIARFLQLAV